MICSDIFELEGWGHDYVVDDGGYGDGDIIVWVCCYQGKFGLG